jgi:hypothetical protein
VKALSQCCDVNLPPDCRVRAATAGQLPSRSDGVGPLMLEAKTQVAFMKTTQKRTLRNRSPKPPFMSPQKETGLVDVGRFGVSLS